MPLESRSPPYGCLHSPGGRGGRGGRLKTYGQGPGCLVVQGCDLVDCSLLEVFQTMNGTTATETATVATEMAARNMATSAKKTATIAVAGGGEDAARD